MYCVYGLQFVRVTAIVVSLAVLPFYRSGGVLVPQA